MWVPFVTHIEPNSNETEAVSGSRVWFLWEKNATGYVGLEL